VLILGKKLLNTVSAAARFSSALGHPRIWFLRMAIDDHSGTMRFCAMLVRPRIHFFGGASVGLLTDNDDKVAFNSWIGVSRSE